MSTGLFYGQIVRIRVARHGKEKLRPVVVVTPNEAMAEGTPLVGVAITGTPDPPTGFEVPLPWQAQGRSRTGLDKPNAA
jgi:mRNA-degrading endonuclease toxin of MazEF toxin-antitoxin module